MASAIDAVYMVEASRELRETQKTLLCGKDAASKESKVGYHSTGKYGNTPIVWTDSIKSIPIGKIFSSRCLTHIISLTDLQSRPKCL